MSQGLSPIANKHSAKALLNAVSQGESASIEFKSSFQKEVIETLTAFANSQGGAVLLGVGDTGSIVGLSIQAETLQGWINQCKQITSPRLIPDIELVQIENKTVAIVSISDYRSAKDSTIKVHDNRIEFFNPGTLLDDLTVEKIKTGNYKSHLRNKQVATIFKELELIENMAAVCAGSLTPLWPMACLSLFLKPHKAAWLSLCSTPLSMRVQINSSHLSVINPACAPQPWPKRCKLRPRTLSAGSSSTKKRFDRIQRRNQNWRIFFKDIKNIQMPRKTSTAHYQI